MEILASHVVSYINLDVLTQNKKKRNKKKILCNLFILDYIFFQCQQVYHKHITIRTKMARRSIHGRLLVDNKSSLSKKRLSRRNTWLDPRERNSRMP